jgi:hypothetical protein
MIKRTLIAIMLLSVLPLLSNAQRWKMRRFETSLGLGATSFYGDIGGTADTDNALGFKDIQIQYSRPSVLFGASYRVASNMNVKMNLIYGFLRADDVESRNENRNFAFTSTIFEPSFQFEYYIISENSSFSSSALFNRRGMLNNYSNIYLYAFGGIGGVFSNPKPEKNFVDRFEDNFSKFGIAFPIGLGFKYIIDSEWSLGIELGRRFTLTDYIDGYTSQFSDHNDTYYIGSLQAIYKFRTDRRGMPIFKRAYR